MADHLSEEEQIEALKRWWKENGKATVAAVALSAAGFFGWNQYKDHQIRVTEEGSALYEEFIAATTELDDSADKTNLVSIQALADGIISHNESSLYATFARLHMAKLAVEAEDLDKAKTLLKAVTDTTENKAIQDLSRMRLARVELASGSADAALALLQTDAGPAYQGAYAELRGDILVSQDLYEEARTAYQSALDSLVDPRSPRRGLLQLKLENATVAEDVVAIPGAPASSGTAPKAESKAEDA